ncbi:MAG: hypothetical protein ABI175_14945, partial [Polyangiales bacterium]
MRTARLTSWVILAISFFLVAHVASAQTGFEPSPLPSASASASASVEAAPPIASASAAPKETAKEKAADEKKDEKKADEKEDPKEEKEKTAEGIVRLKDRKVFSILVDREGQTATERARLANQALEAAVAAKETEARVERHGAIATLFLGKNAIADLDEADAQAAGASSLQAHADDVAAKLQSAIAQEQKRSAIANTVFSFALIVFTALLAFLLLGKVAQLAGKGHDWLDDHPEKIPSLRFGGIELARAGAIEGFLTLGIGIAK